MMALSGVRSSWLMLARNCDLCWLAISSWRLFSWISVNRRTFWMAMTAWAAKVSSNSIWRGENGPTVDLRSSMAPTAVPSRIMGAAITARNPRSLAAVLADANSTGSRAATSGKCFVWASSMAPCRRFPVERETSDEVDGQGAFMAGDQPFVAVAQVDHDVLGA